MLRTVVTGIRNWPEKSSHSYLLSSWVIFSAFLILIYASVLINYLTIPAKAKVPLTWDELLQSQDYDIMMESESYIRRMFEVLCIYDFKIDYSCLN